MNFGRGRSREEPEINLIPMIDILLVIIIFLMLTTTYSRFAGLEINLPTADAQASADKPAEINVAVTAAGEVVINKRPVSGSGIGAIAAAMQAVVSPGAKDPVVIINADAKAAHQRVIDVMQAAQQAGFVHISFATQAIQR
ncbi:ExbD/TolR family protein [Zoogloea dura]|uniref:Biopolymer transporter ExbD n=1 Tax=Zoogloea dura TaxID=2728840 RepID=A0A848G0Q3_9RHOO|nr:biopolymer transporter ExbD [Zoogloea dura]NML24630.1 biopolymer transporter ExbD [Zoogloea dura]